MGSTRLLGAHPCQLLVQPIELGDGQSVRVPVPIEMVAGEQKLLPEEEDTAPQRGAASRSSRPSRRYRRDNRLTRWGRRAKPAMLVSGQCWTPAGPWRRTFQRLR